MRLLRGMNTTHSQVIDGQKPSLKSFRQSTNANSFAQQGNISKRMTTSDGQLSSLIRSAMDAVICIDNNQRITLFNAAAERMFGFSADAMMGQALERLIPAQHRLAHHAHVTHFGQHGETSRRMGQQRVLLALRANGEQFSIEASISRAIVNGQVIYSAIVRDVTERINAAQALDASRLEVQALTRVALQAREEEKSRVAREIHDELGQKMTALKLDLLQLRAELNQPNQRVSECLLRMQQLVDETVANTRRIAADLRPLMLDDLGLGAALEWQVQQFRLRTDIVCELLVDPELDRLSSDIASHVFRIVQEALNNVAKHAAAQTVSVHVVDEGNAVAITISDDGIGLKPQAKSSGSKRGLVGIRERAAAQGGDFELENLSHGGVKLSVTLPYLALQP